MKKNWRLSKYKSNKFEVVQDGKSQKIVRVTIHIDFELIIWLLGGFLRKFWQNHFNNWNMTWLSAWFCKRCHLKLFPLEGCCCTVLCLLDSTKVPTFMKFKAFYFSQVFQIRISFTQLFLSLFKSIWTTFLVNLLIVWKIILFNHAVMLKNK